jgi:hypothetical protein
VATYYWVSDGTTKTGYWYDINHWSLTSNGPGGAGIPLSSDNVIFNASSGSASDICYIDSGSACNNITANAASTAIHLQITGLDIYGNVAIGSSVVFDNAFGTINHYVLGGTTNTINYGSKVVPNYLYFFISDYFLSGITGTFTMASGVTAVYEFTIASGTFNTANNAINTANFNIDVVSYESGPVIFNAGSSTITLTNLPETYGYTNIPPQWYLEPGPSPAFGYTVTYNTGTSIINMGSNTVANQINDAKRFFGGGKTYNRLNLLGTVCEINDANTFGILSVVIPATTLTVSPYAVAILTLVNNQTVTSNYSVSGNAAVQRLTVSSNNVGTARTITIPATRTSNFVDYRDITISGTALAGTSLGNLLGCTNITFTAAVTRYARNVGANFSSTNSWATTSGGAAGASVPLPQDTIIFDNNSLVINADMPYIGGPLTVTNTYPTTYLYSQAGPSYFSIFGLITIQTSSILESIVEPVGFIGVVLANRTSRNFELLYTYNQFIIQAPGATITLNQPLSNFPGAFYRTLGITAGTLNTNGQTVSLSNMFVQANDSVFGGNTSGATLNLSSSNIYLYNQSNSAVFIYLETAYGPITFNAGTSNIYCLNEISNTSRSTFCYSNDNDTDQTFYNVYFGALSTTVYNTVKLTPTTTTTNPGSVLTFNTLGMSTAYPCNLLISINPPGAYASQVYTNNIESSAASSGKTLIFASDEALDSSFVSLYGYQAGVIVLYNASPTTLNYVAFKNITLTSDNTVIAYGVANLGNTTGNNLVLASPVAVAAYTTTGNYSITMPTNYAGSSAIMVVGGGSAGTRSSSTGFGGAGGGAGGTSFGSNFNLTAGQTLYINVGVGGSATSGASGLSSWLNSVSNTSPSNPITGVLASGGSGSNGGSGSGMISLRGGNGGTGLSSSSGGGAGGGGAPNSFTTTYSNTQIKGGNVSGSNGIGGGGGGGVRGVGSNVTSSTGGTGGAGFNTSGGAAGVAGTGGSGSGGGSSGNNGGGPSTKAGDIIAWFTNGVAAYTDAGPGGGGGGGGAYRGGDPAVFAGGGGQGGIGAGGGGAGGSSVINRNGAYGNGGNGLVLLLYSTYVPTVYATILGED